MERSRYRLFVNKFGAGNAHASLGWARGPRPAWRRGARFVRWAVDVGLDSLALSHQGERASFCPKAKKSLKPRKTLSLPPQKN